MKQCNMCGKKFNTYDHQLDFGFNHYVSYGSRFDGDDIIADFCCDCHDKIVVLISRLCLHPFVADDDSADGTAVKIHS